MNVSSLTNFSAKLRSLPRVVAIKVAEAAAPALTAAAAATFNASSDAFGGSWMPGEKGQTVTLQKSGSLARTIRYVAIGTKLRVQLGVAYAKYQIGRRPIFPKQGDALPTTYVQALTATTARVIREELGL